VEPRFEQSSESKTAGWSTLQFYFLIQRNKKLGLFLLRGTNPSFFGMMQMGEFGFDDVWDRAEYELIAK
jgi:hypothetical protein